MPVYANSLVQNFLLKMASETCFFCYEDVHTGPNRVIKSKGIQSVITASLSRDDEKHKILTSVDNIKAHDACYKSYVSQSNISAAKKRKRSEENANIPSSSKQRVFFNYEELCIICGEKTGDEYLAKRKYGALPLGNVHIIQEPTTQAKIVELASSKNDENSQDILDRVSNVRNVSSIKARYHKNCFRQLELAGTERTRKSDATACVMNHIENYLKEHSEECQFSLDDILYKYEGEKPSEKWILKKIKEKYENDIIITCLKNRPPIICYYKNTAHEFLYKTWSEKKQEKTEDERLRIIKEAGEIIVQDIRSKVYFVDEYPSPMKFLNNAEDDIPDTLKLLLETIILKNKHGDLDKLRVKIIAIAHAIISAVRPRSFISSILTALASFMLKKFGSSTLVDMLSAFGFSATYREARLFEISSVIHPCLQVNPEGFFQFVFDNVDHQICTLTGSNTLHAMAGIQCVTPENDNLFNFTIPRLTKIPSSGEVGKYGRVDIIPFNKNGPGLSSINLENIQDLNPISNDIEVDSVECFWFYKKFSSKDKIPGLFI